MYVAHRYQATFGLVVGYSWIDGNLPVAGNPGLGWTIGWKRFVQVMIGMSVLDELVGP